MKKFAFFSDLLFTFIVGGLFTLLLFRSLQVRFTFSLPLSLLCGGLTTGAVAALLKAKRKKLYLKKSDELQKEKLLTHLALLSDEAKTEYFQAAFSTQETPYKRFGRLRIFNQTEFYFLQFRFHPLTADEIPAVARLKTGKKKILLCAKIEEEALSLCRRLDIEVRTEEWVYSRLKSALALPKNFLGEELPKQRRSFKLWFSRKNAKRFLASGSLVLLPAFLTPFPTYYLLFGAALLLTAVFVRIFGKE